MYINFFFLQTLTVGFVMTKYLVFHSMYYFQVYFLIRLSISRTLFIIDKFTLFFIYNCNSKYVILLTYRAEKVYLVLVQHYSLEYRKFIYQQRKNVSSPACPHYLWVHQTSHRVCTNILFSGDTESGA